MQRRKIAPDLLARAAWSADNFSDPNFHNPHEFKYIVHTIRPSQFSDILIANPQAIANNYLISASVVDQLHRNVFGGVFGFILKVHPENVYATSSDDMGLSNLFTFGRLSSDPKSAKQELILLKRSHGIQAPNVILENTLPGHYNEIALMGTSRGKKVEVVGIIADKSLSSENLDFVYQMANEHHLPVVFIQE